MIRTVYNGISPDDPVAREIEQRRAAFMPDPPKFEIPEGWVEKKQSEAAADG